MEHRGNARLDVARGLAALIVFFSHSTQIFVWRLLEKNSWLETITGNAARQAVLVFFVLSGYLITKSIVSNVKRNGHFEPAEYLISRAARIYPPFLFALGLTILVAAIVNHFNMPLGTVRPDLHYNTREIPNALILSNGLTVPNGPLWTLYIEVQLYLIAFGFAALLFGPSKILKLLGFAAVAFAIYRCQSLYNTHLFAMAWVVGAAASWVPTRVFRFISIPSLALVILLLACGPILRSEVMDSGINEALQIACCIFYADLLILSRSLEFAFPAWLVKTGGYSYTLYVIHFPILLLLLAVSISVIGTSWPLTIAATAASMFLVLIIALRAAPIIEDTKKFKSLMYRLTNGPRASNQQDTSYRLEGP